ncbi:Ig-like domain-containing protein, partial [Pseudomonas lactis]
MTEVFVFDKKTQAQTMAFGAEVVLEAASVVVIGVSRASIKQMTRKGQSLVIELAGNEKLVIKNYFDKFEGQENSLSLNEDGQLFEAAIDESVGLGDQLVVSFEPFQPATAVAVGESSILGQVGATFEGLSPLSKAGLLAGAALGIFALTQGGKGGSNKHHSAPAPVDTTAPDAPQIKVSTQADGKMAVSGTAEAGSRVDFTFPDGSKISVTANSGGSFNFVSDVPQPNGPYSATATDAAKNTSKPTTGNFTADSTTDTTPPAKATDLVTSTESDGKMTVGGKAEPGSTVEVKFPDGTTGTTVAKPDGSFELTSETPQPNGEFTTTVTDAAGNKGESVTGEFVADPTADTTPPGKATDLVTSTESDGKMTVGGKAEPGSTVEVKFPDGTTGTTVAKPDGSFELTSDTPQPNGEFTTTVTDAAGNKGESVTSEFVADPTADTTPPGKATDLVTSTESDGKMTVGGKAEPGSTVEVKFPDGTTGTTVAKPDGSFELTSETPQPNGEFTTTVTDAAGNKGESVTGEFVADPTADTTPPGKATDLVTSTESDGKMTVGGKAEPGSTVEVKFPDGTTGTTVAKPDGSFELTSETPQPNGEFTTTVTDAAGNKGESVTGEFVADPTADTTPPGKATDLVTSTESDGKMTVGGKAEPGSTVEVKFPDGTTGTTVAKPDGSFELTSETPQPNGEFTTTVTDAAGNKGESVTGDYTATGVDNQAPDAPTGLAALTQPDGKVKVTGQAEPNSTVTVTLPDGTVETIKAGPDGKFELVSKTPQPSGDISVTATDAAGNTGSAAIVPFQASNAVDTTAPEAPSGLAAETQPDGKVKVSGNAEPNSTVTVTLPDGTVETIKAGPDGKFELVSKTPQPSGDISVTATDAAGNTGPAATVPFTASNTIDTTAPEAPTGLAAETQPDGKVKVTGQAESNSTVTVTLPDGTVETIKAGPDGKFELVSKTSQPSGDISVTATDAAGNTSPAAIVPFQASNAVDTTAPEAPTGLAAETQPDGKVKVNGQAEPNSTVTVTLPDGTVETIKAGPDGKFELVSKTPQPSGDISVTATDAAGNTSPAATVPFTASNTIDTTAPEAPTGLAAETQPDGKVKVTGQAEPNSTVTVTLPDGTVETIKAGPDGKFELVSKTPQPSGDISVTATDAAGNTGPAATVPFTASNTIDTTAPEAPTGLAAETQPDGKVKVTGQAEPNSTVTVTLPDGTVETIKAGPDGKFELVSKTPQPSGNVSVTATDAAGNTSPAATVPFTASNTIDTTAPEAPTGLAAETQPDGKVKVSGNAEPNSTVTVTLPDGTVETIKAGPDGKFELVSKTPQP